MSATTSATAPGTPPTDHRSDTVTLDANKALVRHIFEDVIPAGDAAAMRDLVLPDFLDHDP